MFTVVLIGSIVGFSGAALGSVGGVGGGGNACLDHWFDPKSSTAISKCMIMGAAGSTPMFMLGISIGVAFNVMFANWMVTVLLIILFLVLAVTAAKALMKGMETWKKETMMKKEAEEQLESESKPFGETLIKHYEN
ncbi:unnamed protein product [Prunus armeniaca]